MTNKVRITIENDGAIQRFEADSAVIMHQNQNGDLTLAKFNVSDALTVGLLEMGIWHAQKAWEGANLK